MLIDYEKTWQLAEQRLARENDPRRRQVLAMMIAHMRAERAADLEALMATVSPRAAYHMWGSTAVDLGPKGRDGVRAFYQSLIDGDCARVAHEITRLTVDRDSIVTEGMLRIAYPGRVLDGMGIEVDDPSAYYLYESRMAIVWEFDEDGLVVAEDSYSTGDGFRPVRKLGPADVPDLPSRAA